MDEVHLCVLKKQFWLIFTNVIHVELHNCLLIQSTCGPHNIPLNTYMDNLFLKEYAIDKSIEHYIEEFHTCLVTLNLVFSTLKFFSLFIQCLKNAFWENLESPFEYQ